MAAPPIRIVVVDDSPLYRRTIRKILEKQPNLQIVAEAGDGVYGIQAVKTHRPDVVLMDVTLPILNGIDATRKIKSKFPKVRVIVLSMHDAESISEAASWSRCMLVSQQGLFTERTHQSNHGC